MISDLKLAPGRVKLKMTMARTKILTDDITPITTDEKAIYIVTEYVYLGLLMKLGIKNEQA